MTGRCAGRDRGGSPARPPRTIRPAEEGDDFIAVRQMAYFALSFDHRIIDGADAERFLSQIKATLESGESQV